MSKRKAQQREEARPCGRGRISQTKQHSKMCDCLECCYRRKHPQLAPREEFEPDYGGVLGADGQVYSDADPGL